MRILVTGHMGMVGQAVTSCLTSAGHEVVGFDLVAGQDVLDADSLTQAVSGCDAVVHLAALDEAQDEDSPFAELGPASTAGDSTIIQNIPLSARLSTPLSSVQVPLAQIATTAIDLIVNPGKEPHIRKSMPTLIPRESSGSPKHFAGTDRV